MASIAAGATPLHPAMASTFRSRTLSTRAGHRRRLFGDAPGGQGKRADGVPKVVSCRVAMARMPSFRRSTNFDLEKELEPIVGLSEVKDMLRGISNAVEVRKKRQGMGVNDERTMHMLFLGGPGTGKTTVALVAHAPRSACCKRDSSSRSLARCARAVRSGARLQPRTCRSRYSTLHLNALACTL